MSIDRDTFNNTSEDELAPEPQLFGTTSKKGSTSGGIPETPPLRLQLPTDIHMS